MNHPFIVGKSLYLRPLEKSDIDEAYIGWVNDIKVTQNMVTGAFPNNMEKLEAYYHSMTTSSSHVILAIADKKTNKHIGNIALNGINWIDRIANLGIMIGDKSYWGKGYGTEATKLMVSYAFNRLNLHKLWLGVYAGHKAAIRIYEKAGFVEEGCLKQEFYRNGKYHDTTIMGLINEG